MYEPKQMVIYNTKENDEKFDKMLKDIDEEYRTTLINFAKYKLVMFAIAKHIDENGVEFWYARELMPILQYAKWQNFKKIIDKAMIACQNS